MVLQRRSAAGPAGLAAKQGTAGDVQPKSAQRRLAGRPPTGAKATRERLELLEQVIGSLPVWISVNDATGRFVLVNEALASGHGMKPQDFIGRSFMEIEAQGHPDARLMAMLDDMVRVTGHSMERPRYDVRLPDGRERVHRVVKLPLLGGEGEILGVVGWSEDITDQVNGEDALEGHRELLQAVFDVVPHPLAYVDRHQKVQMVNDAWCRQSGVNRREVIGVSILDLAALPVPARSSMYEENAEILRTGIAPPPREISLPDADGTVNQMVLSKSPIFDSNHHVAGIVAIRVNITDLRRTEVAAKLAHQRLMDALDSIPAVIYLYDAEERLIMANAMAKSIWPMVSHLMVPGTKLELLVSEICKTIFPDPAERAQIVERRLREFRQIVSQVEQPAPGGRHLLGHDRRTTEGGTVSIRFDITEQKRIQSELEQRERESRAELALAAGLQRQILRPVAPPRFLAEAHEYRPSSFVSGDIYHAGTASDGSFMFFLGDATGHGVSAALITMLVEATLRGMAEDAPPEQMADELNTQLVNYRLDGMFVSGIFLHITPDGVLTACNAGHPAALVLGAGRRVAIDSSGVPMGWFDAPGYGAETVQLQPGDRVVLYTDGLTERNNPAGEEFGCDAVERTLRGNAELPPAQLVPALVSASSRHAAGQDPLDDLSLFVFEYCGVPEATRP